MYVRAIIKYVQIILTFYLLPNMVQKLIEIDIVN